MRCWWWCIVYIGEEEEKQEKKRIGLQNRVFFYFFGKSVFRANEYKMRRYSYISRASKKSYLLFPFWIAFLVPAS